MNTLEQEFVRSTLDLTLEELYWDNLGEEVVQHIRKLISAIEVDEEDLIFCGFNGDKPPHLEGTTWGCGISNLSEENLYSDDNPLSYALNDAETDLGIEPGRVNLAMYDKRKLEKDFDIYRIIEPSALIEIKI